LKNIKEPDVLSYYFEKEKEEIWIEGRPLKGDHIKVNRNGIYTHHGIYVSNEEVIHFTGEEDDNVLDWSKNEVIKTDLVRFLLGGTLERKVYTDSEQEDLYPIDHIVVYARASIGERGYDLIFNNCEHFANVCTLGRFRSPQVERVFQWIFPKERGKDMWLGDIFRNIFGKSGGGSRSASSTTYEPDKVKIAEIEQETQLQMAGMDHRKIELMKQARIEVLEQEHYLKEAMIEAEARGLSFVAQTVVAIQKQLNEITEKRLEILEKGSLSIIKEIEDFYIELGDRIREENEEYNMTKLPILLNTLNQFEEGTPAFNLYQKRIDDDMNFHMQSITRQLEQLSARQGQLIDGFLKSKDRIIEHTSQITSSILQQAQQKQINNNVVDRVKLGAPVGE